MIRLVFLIVTTAALMFAGCSHEAETSAADPVTISADVMKVESKVSPREVEVYGTIHAGKEATLTSRATGPVVRVLVGAGDIVKKGDVLIELEERMSGGQLAQAQGALAQAQAALSVAVKNYTRFQSLYKKDACSELELDMARMQYEQASGAVEQASGAVQTAASVADEAKVRAPFDATVVQTMIDVGDLAAPGRPLVQVQSNAGREFVMQIRASLVDYMKIGDEIHIRLNNPERLVEAVITEVAGGADPATHTFLVKAVLSSDDVRAGVAGHALIKSEAEKKLLVPANAIYRTGGLELVSIVDGEGTTHTRAVTTRASGSGMVEILSGLTGGEELVINRTGPISEGTRIEGLR
ncbi:efflux RND transporter periplasmic adaptor subunit [bacterium]|nr:MAG: efflux RND transporter periplasmic adaptor subunit [bacterium]